MFQARTHPRTSITHRVVDAGRVTCPVEGADVDLERCERCPALIDLVEDGPCPYVSCRPLASGIRSGTTVSLASSWEYPA